LQIESQNIEIPKSQNLYKQGIQFILDFYRLYVVTKKSNK